MFSSALTFIIIANWNIFDRKLKEIPDAYILYAVGFVMWAIVEKNLL